MQLSQYVLPNEKGQFWTDLITTDIRPVLRLSYMVKHKKSQLEDWLSYSSEWTRQMEWYGLIVALIVILCNYSFKNSAQWLLNNRKTKEAVWAAP